VTIRSTGDLAAAVRGRRRDRGWSQLDLAAKAGVSRKWISELEAGKSRVELGLVIKVLEQLGLTIDVIETAARAPRTKNAVDLDDVIARHRRT
jgi:HTH-type transcriptional regulator / antitoxin HipB